MSELQAVRESIREIETIRYADRTPEDKTLLAGYIAKEARLSGINCVLLLFVCFLVVCCLLC